jgi:predicted deacylase
MKQIIIAFLVLYSAVINAQYKEVFSIGSIQASPGEKVSGKLIVNEGVDKGSFIPVSIISGEKPGPVLTLNAGIHGTEYVPVIALQKILKEIDPAELSGTLVLVHIANVPSFLGRGVYSNPIDFKNLNRVYPGKAEGTFSERLAFKLSNEVIDKSDYYIDLHGGEFNESLLNFLYFYYGCPDEELCRKSRILAHAIGNTYMFPFDYTTVPESEPSEFSEYEAMRRGVPAIGVEFGDRGLVDPEILEFAVTGIKNIMKTIGMLEGESFVVENPSYLLDEQTLRSKSDGIFYSFVEKGDHVEENALLGYITDYWGNRIEEIRAPFSGIVVITLIAPAVNKGDHVIQIAKVAETFDLK